VFTLRVVGYLKISLCGYVGVGYRDAGSPC